MKLFSVLYLDSAVSELVSNITSLLGTPSCLESLEKIPTKEDGAILFQYPWNSREEFQQLENEFGRIMV